jgi:hypothetical protein
VNVPLSSAHVKVAPASEVKLKLAVAELLGLVGDALIVAVGAVVSIVHVELAEAPVLPAASVAWTWNVWLPSPSPLRAAGELQAANAPASTAHWKVAPASELNAKVALELVLGFDGVEVIETLGGVESIVQLKLAGVASTLPSASAARTWKLWAPSASPEYAFGDEHEANAPASSAHSNVAGDSLALNAKLAAEEFVDAAGCAVIVVSGPVLSTVQVKLAGVASVPTASFARTWNVCDPSPSPL